MKIKRYNSGIQQPEDRGIVLKDIIEDGVVDRDKSYCVDASYFKGGNPPLTAQPKGGEAGYSGLIQVGMTDDIKGRETQRRIYSPLGKAPTLPTMQGGNTQPKVSILQRGRGNNKGGERALDGKTPALSSSSWQYNNYLWLNGLTYRKLTVLECERLQTLRDGFTEGVSNSQRYKMIGNGFTIDVIAHIFGFIK